MPQFAPSSASVEPFAEKKRNEAPSTHRRGTFLSHHNILDLARIQHPTLSVQRLRTNTSSTSAIMAYLPRSALARRRSANKYSRSIATKAPSLLTILFACLAVFAFAATFAPATVGVAAQDSTKKSEYGTVIGIDLGTTWVSHTTSSGRVVSDLPLASQLLLRWSSTSRPRRNHHQRPRKPYHTLLRRIH